MIQKQIQERQKEKKKKRNKSFKKEIFFLLLLSSNGKTPVLVTYSLDEASEFHHFDPGALFVAVRPYNHATPSSTGAQSPQSGLFTHTYTHTKHE